MTHRFRPASQTRRRYPGHLRVRGRTVLQIIVRTENATAASLAVLAR